MLLTNPIWLWALAGLSIPIGIHLLSRKEGKVIRIGSLRHLQETNTQQFKGIRLNEIVLLTLRCALIILFVLLMSGLSFERTTASETKWVLVEKGLENKREVQIQLDTFQSQGYELRWLTDGFPLFDDSASISSNSQYWILTEQLQSQKIFDILVFSKNRIDGFKGKRPTLPSNIRWISVPSESAEFVLSGVSFSDSVIVRTGYTNPEKTHFRTQTHSQENWNQPVSPKDTVEIVIVTDNTHLYDLKIIKASLLALKRVYPIELELIYSSPEKINLTGFGNWCIWLAAQPASDSDSSNIIYLKPALNKKFLVQERLNRWIITKRLNEEIALSENLTVQLASILLSSEKDEEIALQNDRRMLPDESTWSKGDSDATSNASLFVQPADSYLLIILLFTLLIERTLAYYRNQ